MYFEAYQKASLSSEQAPLTEYRLFAQITRELEEANSSSDAPSKRINSLFRNNQLWLALKADLMSEDNGLNNETKAGLISIALWVNRFTPSAMKGGVDLTPLISVNKDIMEGLKAAAKQKTAPVQQQQMEAFSQISV